MLQPRLKILVKLKMGLKKHHCRKLYMKKWYDNRARNAIHLTLRCQISINDDQWRSLLP